MSAPLTSAALESLLKVAQQLENQASDNGCYGEVPDGCCVTNFVDPSTWCPYCLMGEASKHLRTVLAERDTTEADHDEAKELLRGSISYWQKRAEAAEALLLTTEASLRQLLSDQSATKRDKELELLREKWRRQQDTIGVLQEKLRQHSATDTKRQAVVAQALSALESDATYEMREGAFDALRDEFYPWSATGKEPITTIPPIHADLLNENWHAIAGPNGQCECGVEKGVCGDRLKRFVWVQIKSQGDDIGGQGLSATDKVSAPPPSENDYQVSLEGAPDFDLNHFSGGIESIERKGALLIFQFTNGGRLCVPGAVTYHAPERH